MSKTTVQPYKSNGYILATLMLTVVIDMMGFGLIFPLLSSLFISGSNSFIDINTSLHIRYIYYSLAFSLWPIGAFFGTPYLGELSDRFGRRKILSICLFMTGASYALSAISISTGSLFLFFFSRFFSGFFGGCYDIAQAATADISTPELKARNMGWITFAVSIGMILGPIISGFTSDGSYIRWFSVTTPFWIAALLAFFNGVLLFLLFSETYKINKQARIKLAKVFSSFLFIFTDSRVRRLGLIFLMLNIGWCFFVTSIPLILTQKFHFDIRFTGIFFCFIGLGFTFSILFVQKKVLKLFTLKKIYIITTVISTFLLVGNFFYPSLSGLWPSAFFFALFEVLCYSSLLAMISNSVTVDLQGKVMGGLGAVASISFIIAGILLPFLSDLSVVLPLLAGGIAYLTSTCIMLGTKE